MRIRLTTESGYPFDCQRRGVDRAAETVVALHGFGGANADFEHLTELLPQWNWLMPNWLGHGMAPLPAVTPDGMLDAQMEVLTAVLASIDGPVRLLGYSMGARLALHYLVRGGSMKIRAAYLIGVSPGLTDPEARADRLNADEKWAAILRQEGLAAFRRQWSQQPLLRSRLDPSSALGQRIEAARAAQQPEGLATCIVGMSPGRVPDLWPHLDSVRTPVTVIVGSEDQKFLEIGRRLQPLLPNSRLAVVAGAGHAVHLDNPAGLVGWLRVGG